MKFRTIVKTVTYMLMQFAPIHVTPCMTSSGSYEEELSGMQWRGYEVTRAHVPCSIAEKGRKNEKEK